MAIKKEVWYNEYTKVTYGTEQEAKDSENEYIKKQKIEQSEADFVKIFPFKHVEDTRFRIHCVRCGCLIREYEVEYDYIDNWPGYVLFSAPHEIIFKGRYCTPCYQNKKSEIISLYKLQEACKFSGMDNRF